MMINPSERGIRKKSAINYCDHISAFQNDPDILKGIRNISFFVVDNDQQAVNSAKIWPILHYFDIFIDKKNI